MKAKNANLQKAKKEANDEFYTQYEDIAKEIEHYKKPPKDEKPSELRTVWGVRGGKIGSEYFSLVFLIACFIMVINFILATI